MNVTEKKSNQCKINLYGYLRIHAEERPSAPFLISDGETVNYGRALGIVRSVATDLISAGVRKGDKVAFRITSRFGFDFACTVRRRSGARYV